MKGGDTSGSFRHLPAFQPSALRNLDLPAPHNRVSQNPKIKLPSLSTEYPFSCFCLIKQESQGQGVPLNEPTQAVPTRVPAEVQKPWSLGWEATRPALPHTGQRHPQSLAVFPVASSRGGTSPSDQFQHLLLDSRAPALPLDQFPTSMSAPGSQEQIS